MSEELIKTLGVVAEVMGHELSPNAARMMIAELSQYNEPMVLAALRRCARECKYKLSLADIISRLDDGRPGAEEAWSMLPKQECDTVVWTNEMAVAYGVAAPLIELGDLVAARMAFKESYAKQLTQAQTDGVPVKWLTSLGHDPHGRAGPVRAAVVAGKISLLSAVTLVHELEDDEELKLITNSYEVKRLD